MLKKYLMFVLGGSALLAANAKSANFEDYARVVSVTPKIEQVSVPTRICRTVMTPPATYPQPALTGGALLGGLAGGLLGSQLGGGNGRIAAAAIGAATGALVGDRASRDDRSFSDNERGTTQYCETANRWESHTVGYVVYYEYNNRVFSTVTDTPPGTRLSVAVTLTPYP
jgi:uncharacterized protein YcfJ